MANGGIRTAEDGSFAALMLGNSDVARFGGATGDNSGQLNSYRNLLINSSFQINNGNAGTPYVSGAVLAAGQTGHECWKAGSSGGDYAFTQNAAITGITLVSGKSLIQVIEDKFVKGGNYILSWEGTAKCRAGVNSATPTGSYVTSPLVITGQSKGVTMSIEVINDGTGGTFSEPQLERSSIVTEYEFGSDELHRTQRYTEVGSAVAAGSDSVQQYYGSAIGFKATKRASPVVSIISTLSSTNASSPAVSAITTSGFLFSTLSQAGGYAIHIVTFLALARL